MQEENDRSFCVPMCRVSAKDIEVSTEDGTLTVRGERPAKERAAGSFLRRFTLPDSVQSEAIKAHYADGVLESEIPKQPRVEAKRVLVTAN